MGTSTSARSLTWVRAVPGMSKDWEKNSLRGDLWTRTWMFFWRKSWTLCASDRVGPEVMVQKMIKGLEHLSCEQAEGTGLVQHREENAPHCTFSVLKGGLYNRGTFHRDNDRTMGNISN